MKRNITLDYYKLLMAVLIIISHMPPLLNDHLTFSWIFSFGITRIAVPTFFLINGYYLANKIDDWQAVKKYLKHLLLIYTIWYLIYLPYDNFLFVTVGYDNILLNLLNAYGTGFLQLWYMPALILGVICLYTAKKVLRNDFLLLAAGIIIFVAANILSWYIWQVKIYRNGITVGFPFLMIGYLICKYNVAEKIKGTYVILASVLSLALVLSEAYSRLMRHEVGTDLQFSFILCAPALFILVMKYAHFSDKSNSYLSHLSSAIYFVHIHVLFYLIPVTENSLYKLPLVVLVSGLLSLVVIFVNKRIKIFL